MTATDRPLEAAFFDLDKTVIAKAAMAAYLRPFSEAGMISRWLLVRAGWSHFLFQTFGADDERMRKFRESALRATRGWDQARVSTLVRDNLHEVIEPLVYEEALDLIRHHKEEGRRVFIVSASPIEVVGPLGDYLGVDEAIATRAKLDDDGRYTGEVEFYSYGPFKVEAMEEIAEREGIDLSASYAYSDSATDEPMLAAVGHPVAVNPDRELARIARQRGWEVRRFEHPVPLRERAVVPPPVRFAIGAGMVVGVVVTGGVVWWARRARRPARSTVDLRTEQLTEQLVEALTEAREQLAETRRQVARSSRTLRRTAPRLSLPGSSSRRTSRGGRRRRGRRASSWRASVGALGALPERLPDLLPDRGDAVDRLERLADGELVAEWLDRLPDRATLAAAASALLAARARHASEGAGPVEGTPAPPD